MTRVSVQLTTVSPSDYSNPSVTSFGYRTDYKTTVLYLGVGLDGGLWQWLDLAPVHECLGAQEAREEVAEAGQLLAVQLQYNL